jgi:ribonuclease HI
MIRHDASLNGITIPGLDRNILVTMFADDTTLYLNKHDRFDTAQAILDRWCKVSGAKFNIEKTEIIPIGTIEHRATVTAARKINPHDQNPLSERIHIANDGDAIRSLGAWIGNHVDDIAPWELILDKIHKGLNRWRPTRPTLHGRQTIIQTVVGGHTQFLTKAQGMPTEIENALTKIIRDFLWDDDSSPRIALGTLYQPTEQGGLNLLDIKARNEAIKITWLKAYLDFSPTRPAWAKVTDLVINAAAPPETSNLARFNTFLQSWNAPTKGPRFTLLNNDTVRMLRVAKKHKTNLAPIRMSPDLRTRLPAWYHACAETKPITTVPAKCLLSKHTISTVADLISVSARLRTPRPFLPHIPNPLCPCTDCDRDRSNGCRNPHACAEEAISRIHLIAPKMNPLEIGDYHDNLSLTPSRKERNDVARRTDGLIRFDPSITNKKDLTECFRIFTDPDRISNLPARRYHTRGINHQHQGITIYTDGASMNNGKLDARCGGGVWVGPNNERNTSIRVPGTQQSNQVGEIAAIIVATASIPRFWPLTIISDSKYAIDGLTVHLQTWENDGWIGIKNANLFKKAAHILRSRITTTDFKWVKGHDGTLGNEESDRLAKEGANKPETDVLPLEIPIEFDLQGAKLATITQATAYRGIRERQSQPPRPTTTRNIQNARAAIHEYNGNLETDEALWKGTRNNNIRTRIQQFLYKALHGTQKIGNFWENIPGYEARQICHICDETESIEHILVRCTTTPPNMIWDLAKNTWPHAPHWPEISIGIILGCGTISPPGIAQPEQPDANRNHGRVPRGATRLLQILISESAHLIWVLRCERVIQERTHTPSEIRCRWLRVINARLTDDKIIATKIKRGEETNRKVRHTWEHVLKKQMDLPRDWIASPEVLVGSRA